MVLADRIRLANTRQLLRAFGGLNETYGCSEAEYSAGVNFSTRDFPALSTRTPRRRLRALTGLNGMYHLNGLLTVCGRDVVYTPDDAAAPAVTKLDAVTDGRKALVGIGTKILIFPDKLAFDTADGSVTALGALWTAAGKSVTFAPCDAAGKTYQVEAFGREEPAEPADGQLFFKGRGCRPSVAVRQHAGDVQQKLRQLGSRPAGILPHHGGRAGQAVPAVGHRDCAGRSRRSGGAEPGAERRPNRV